MFKRIRQFFRDNPRIWLAIATAILTFVLVVWGVYFGFQSPLQQVALQLSKSSAQQPSSSPTPSGCLLTYTSCSGNSIFNHYSNCNGDNFLDCTQQNGTCSWDGDTSKPTATCVPVTTSLAVGVGTGGGGGGASAAAAGGTCSSHTGAARPATLSVVCGTTSNILTWQNPTTLNADENVVVRQTNGGSNTTLYTESACWDQLAVSTYTDRNINPANSYSYHIKTDPNVVSNIVACPATNSSPLISASVSPSPSPTQTMTSSPTVVGTTTQVAVGGGLTCSPQFQTVAVGAPATLTAQGGDGIYSWSPGPSAVQLDGGPGFGTYEYLVAGIKNATVSSAGQTVICQIQVVEPAQSVPPTFVPSPTPVIAAAIVSGPAGVSTGPDDVVILAFSVAAAAAFLYAGYTRSSLFRSHEVRHISRDQKPLDFMG